jgi:hypothetical protein
VEAVSESHGGSGSTTRVAGEASEDGLKIAGSPGTKRGSPSSTGWAAAASAAPVREAASILPAEVEPLLGCPTCGRATRHDYQGPGEPQPWQHWASAASSSRSPRSPSRRRSGGAEAGRMTPGRQGTSSLATSVLFAPCLHGPDFSPFFFLPDRG